MHHWCCSALTKLSGLFVCTCLSVCACITVYNKPDCVQAGCLLLLRAYSMSANKTSDLFLPASRTLSREAELLSSVSPVIGSPWSNRLLFYPRTVAVTISVPSSEVFSGPVLWSSIHSGLASCALCHLATLNPFFFLFTTEWVPHYPPPTIPPCSPPSSPCWRD